jgi:uncharacterized protein (TIGR02679 family)
VSVRRQVGEPITGVVGVPNGLVCHRVDAVVTDETGTERVRTNRRRVVVIREVAFVAGERVAPDTLVHRLGHARLRELLTPGSRRATAGTPHDVGVQLARAGLVELRARTKPSGQGLTAEPWHLWYRTAEGDQLIAAYAGAGERDGDATALAVTIADERAQSIHDWPAALDDACRRIERQVSTALTLTAYGTADGWALSRFAREVTGSTKGLTGRLERLVLDALAHRDAPELIGASSASDRGGVWAAAGLGVDALGVTVTCTGLPPGTSAGPAARLLTVAAADTLPSTISLVRLLNDDAPVGPPPDDHPGWVFVVENEALLSQARRSAPSTPMVWGANRAAVLLLRRAAAAGWEVAVSADFEQGGLQRAAGLLRAVDGAVPWRLSEEEYRRAAAAGGSGTTLSGRRVTTAWDPDLGDALTELRVRVTEEDRIELLMADVVAGRPSSC